jgi:hypothetical protein
MILLKSELKPGFSMLPGYHISWHGHGILRTKTGNENADVTVLLPTHRSRGRVFGGIILNAMEN